MPITIYTLEAEQDLEQLTQYIARDNLLAAMKWLDETRATCDLLATQPAIGQRIQTKRFGAIRRHVAGNYLIYYRPAAGGVEILMVIHGARDQKRLI